MKHSLRIALGAGLCIALAALLALPALASSSKDDRSNLVHSQDVIYRGVDLWVTPDNGTSYSDFSEQPIPAGFFCPGSAPFTGMIAFKGGGLKTVPEGILGGADTIIYRMDDAPFDQDGVAITRVKFLALSLLSIEPLQTECGRYDARIRLKGEQPVTSMRIERQSRDSGTYSASLAVNARVIFTPAGGEASGQLELEQNIRFAPNRSSWARQPGFQVRAVEGYARVDVDGDGLAETAIPGPGNFYPGFVLQNGVLARAAFQIPTAECELVTPPEEQVSPPCPEDCHCDPNSEWNSNPSCVNWGIPQCDHCHCPGLPDPRN